MRYIFIFVALCSMAMPGMAYDQRDGSNGVPFLAPDPSLKTSDPFYGGAPLMEQANYNLPPIFGGSMPISLNVTAPDWMNLSEHNKKLDSNTTKIIAKDSYELTEYQMRFIPLGQESWL